MKLNTSNIIFLSLCSILMSCSLGPKWHQEHLPIETLVREKINYVNKDTAIINFIDSEKNKTDLIIKWSYNTSGEYSTVGPVISMSVKENENLLKLAPRIGLKMIEDIYFESCQLRRQRKGNYIVLLAWGVGEGRSVINEVYLEPTL